MTVAGKRKKKAEEGQPTRVRRYRPRGERLLSRVSTMRHELDRLERSLDAGQCSLVDFGGVLNAHGAYNALIQEKPGRVTRAIKLEWTELGKRMNHLYERFQDKCICKPGLRGGESEG